MNPRPPQHKHCNSNGLHSSPSVYMNLPRCVEVKFMLRSTSGPSLEGLQTDWAMTFLDPVLRHMKLVKKLLTNQNGASNPNICYCRIFIWWTTSISHLSSTSEIDGVGAIEVIRKRDRLLWPAPFAFTLVSAQIRIWGAWSLMSSWRFGWKYGWTL